MCTDDWTDQNSNEAQSCREETVIWYKWMYNISIERRLGKAVIGLDVKRISIQDSKLVYDPT